MSTVLAIVGRVPQVAVYLACSLPGCAARHHLPEHLRLSCLGADAEAAGWDVALSGDRCPDHLPGRPLQLQRGGTP